MRDTLKSRFLCVCACAIVLGAFVLIGSDAPAAWEELPAPPIMMLPGTIGFSEDEWHFAWSFMGYGGCNPFLVADPDNSIYLGHLGLPNQINTWMKFDTTSEVYSNLSSPSATLGNYSLCIANSAGGAYVDDKVFINTDLGVTASLAEYDVDSDSWAWSPVPADVYTIVSTTADGTNEILYVHDVLEGLTTYDPEVGASSLEAIAFPYGNSTNYTSTVGFMNGVLYAAGGLILDNYRGFEGPDGESARIAKAYDITSGTSFSIADLPQPALLVGSGVGGDGIHFIGSHETALGIDVGPGAWFFISLDTKPDEIFHFVYNPEIDSWGVYWNDLPADCLPLSVVEQGGWLYGLFSCRTPNPHFPRMFRTRIDNLTWPPPTTTTTTATTTTTTQPPTDDDTFDDDTTDDDATDDDTVDDDMQDDDVNADAGDDSGGDDDGCGN